MNNYTKSIAALGILATASLYGTPASSRAYVGSDMTVQEVELYMKSRLKTLSDGEVHDLAQHLVALCKQKSFTAADVLALISIESSFRTDVVSHRGAIGLMQLQPETARYIARRANLTTYRRPSDLKNPRTNVTVGVHYLSYLRDRFGSTDLYLAAYNMGPTKLRRLEKARTTKPESVRNYVHDILKSIHGVRRDAVKLAANAN